MKKLFTLITAVTMMALGSATLTSCNDDQEIAYYLAGEWQGEITSVMTNERFNVTMFFDQNANDYYSTSGTGYEVDWGWQGRSSRMAFTWYVRNRGIRINYQDRTRVIAEWDQLPYNANPGQRFSGYFVDWDTGETLAEFYLVKMGY